MKFLKGLAISFLSLILFLSLSLFGAAFVLNQTLLNPNFINKEIDNLNVPAIASDVMSQTMSPVMQVPLGAQSISIDRKVIANVLSDVIKQYEPELKSQAKTAVTSAYNYLLGKTNSLNISFNLAGIKTNLKDTLRTNILDALQKNPPPQLAGLPSQTVQQLITQFFDPALDQFYQQFTSQIPDTYKINEATIPPDALNQLSQIKVYIGYYQLGFKVLIGVIILCVVLIVLVEHNLKGTARSLGLNLLFFGGVGYAIDFLFNRFAPNYASSLINQMAPSGTIPPSILTWLMKLMDDMMAPLQTLSIAIVATGAVLFIASFFLKSPEPKPKV